MNFYDQADPTPDPGILMIVQPGSPQQRLVTLDGIPFATPGDWFHGFSQPELHMQSAQTPISDALLQGLSLQELQALREKLNELIYDVERKSQAS